MIHNTSNLKVEVVVVVVIVVVSSAFVISLKSELDVKMEKRKEMNGEWKSRVIKKKKEN